MPSEIEAMREFADNLWKQELRHRVKDELGHAINGYRAEVVSNPGNGKLIVRFPFDSGTFTFKCSEKVSGAVAGNQVLVECLGGLSNAFIRDYADFKSGLDSNYAIGNAIIRGGWNQMATPNCINKIMSATGPGAQDLFSFDAVNGHQYYFVIDLSRAATQAGNHDFQFYWTGAWTSYHLDGTVKHRNLIVTASASGVQTVRFAKYADYQGNLTLNYINLIDLTDIFGAGNEPSIEQFRILFPDDYYPYHVAQVTPNRNLLDNPWFTVNQRNFSSWDATYGTMSVDRWMLSYGSGGVTASFANGVMTFKSKTGASSGYLRQKFENPEDFNGKQCTLSVLMDDWSVKSGTITRTNGSAQWAYDDGSLRIGFTANNDFSIAAVGAYEAKIRAVKLELGSVSTLANDFPPNYAEELAKCQRYFVRLEPSSTASYFGLGMKAGTDHSLIVPVSLPTTLRTKPTVTVSDPIVVLTGPSSKVLTDATVTVGSWTRSNIIPLTITHSEISSSNAYLLWKNSGYIDFSADL